MTRSSPNQRFFFIHIMKTGGASLERAIEQCFSTEASYPDAVGWSPAMMQKTSVNDLQNLSEDWLRQIRKFSVHMPFFASQLVGPDVLTLTILRDPVARVVSHLKQTKRMEHPYFGSMSLDEIYDTPWLFNSYFNNHQTKAFSMSANDLVELRSQEEQRARLAQYGDNTYDTSDPTAEMLKAMLYAYGWDAPINEQRLATAKANLQRVDILGLLERYDELLATLERDYGLNVQRLPAANTGHQEAVSNELLARIERDNQYDMELYRYAQTLYAERQHASV